MKQFPDYKYDKETRTITRKKAKGFVRTVKKDLRLSPEEYDVIQHKADKYTDGNTSLLIIYAALAFNK